MFNRFTIALELADTSFAHGVVETTANLNYWQQPGALNEHVPTSSARIVKQFRTAERRTGGLDDRPGLFSDQGAGTAARRPHSARWRHRNRFDDDVLGKDPQPDHMDKVRRELLSGQRRR